MSDNGAASAHSTAFTEAMRHARAFRDRTQDEGTTLRRIQEFIPAGVWHAWLHLDRLMPLEKPLQVTLLGPSVRHAISDIHMLVEWEGRHWVIPVDKFVGNVEEGGRARFTLVRAFRPEEVPHPKISGYVRLFIGGANFHVAPCTTLDLPFPSFTSKLAGPSLI